MATGNALSHVWQKKLLNAALGATNITAPTTVYLALFTVTPTDNGGGTEVTTSGTAYVRQAIAFSAAVDNGGSPGSSATQNGAVNFPVATANYGTVVAWGIFDASSAGNLIAWGAWTTSQAVNTGNQFTVPTTNLVVNSY